MTLQVRRVVTGHDATGRAIVKIDEVSQNLVSWRQGQMGCVVWTTESFPVDNTGDIDEGLRQVGTTLNNGTVFRVVEFAPGVAPRNHRTDSIDYAVVVLGEIDKDPIGAWLDRRERYIGDQKVIRPIYRLVSTTEMN
jgi:hypothetical protein